MFVSVIVLSFYNPFIYFSLLIDRTSLAVFFKTALQFLRSTRGEVFREELTIVNTQFYQSYFCSKKSPKVCPVIGTGESNG